MKKNKNIRKAFLWSDVIVILAVVLMGIAFIPFGPGWRELGYTIIACGLCMTPLYIHGYKITGATGVFREESFPVSRDDKESILSFLKAETPSLDIHRREQGGALISVYYQKNNVQYAQYYDYTEIIDGESFPVLKITTAQYETLKKLG